MEVKPYVGNMAYDMTEVGLREMFSQASAKKAITMFNEYMMNDRQLAVSFARAREERSGGFQQRNRNQKCGGGNRRY